MSNIFPKSSHARKKPLPPPPPEARGKTDEGRERFCPQTLSSPVN